MKLQTLAGDITKKWRLLVNPQGAGPVPAPCAPYFERLIKRSVLNAKDFPVPPLAGGAADLGTCDVLGAGGVGGGPDDAGPGTDACATGKYDTIVYRSAKRINSIANSDNK